MEPLINPTARNEKLKGQGHTIGTRQHHIKNWKDSGLSMSAYCRQQGLSISSLSGWVKKYNKSKPLFKPLAPMTPMNQEPLARMNVIEVLFGPHIKIRFLHPIDPSMIVNLIKELGQCN